MSSGQHPGLSVSVSLSVHVPNGRAPVYCVYTCARVHASAIHIWACVVWVCLCPVCAPGNVDVPVPQVFLYVSVPGWILGPPAVLSKGSVSSSLGFQRKKRTVHMGEGERNTKAMALDSVRAVGFPPYSPSSPNTNTHHPNPDGCQHPIPGNIFGALLFLPPPQNSF